MKKIIIVDDDPAIQEALTAILGRAGYEVQTSLNGRLLLEEHFTPPDAIILDKQLSGADGLDICRMLKERTNTQHIPIIMLSASPHIKRLAIEAGADDFLEKPFSLKDLMNTLQRHV